MGEKSASVIDFVSKDRVNSLGIRVCYFLSEKEVCKTMRSTYDYNQGKGSRLRFIVSNLTMILVMILVSIAVNNFWWSLFALAPIAALIVCWVVPEIKIQKFAKEKYGKHGITVEVYWNRIYVWCDDVKSEIPLDGRVRSEETEDMIIIRPDGENAVLIPMKEVDPNFLREVRLRIAAGTISRPLRKIDFVD